MRIIELDAKNCKTQLEFFNAILLALGAPKGHGHSIDALIDSTIWKGMKNKVEPPYTIQIHNVETLPKDVRDIIELVRDVLSKAREDFRIREGRDVEVALEIMSPDYPSVPMTTKQKGLGS